MDTKYKRCGICSIFVFTEVFAGWRYVSVQEHWIKLEWAMEVMYIDRSVF